MPRQATIASFGYPPLNPALLLPIYRAAGCLRCQVSRNPDAPFRPSQAITACGDAGVEIDSLHGLFGLDLDPSCPDEPARKRAVDVYRAEADLALELDGPYVVVHPAPFDTATAPPLSERERSLRTTAMRKSMDDLAAIGERAGVTYLIENLPTLARFGTDPLTLSDMVRAVGSDRVRLCFDTGHAHLVAHEHGLSASQLLDRCAGVVTCMHLHDNDGQSDSHLLPGRGTLDWKAMGASMANLAADLPAAVEVFVEADDLARADLSVLRGLFTARSGARLEHRSA